MAQELLTEDLKKRFAGVHTIDGIFDILRNEFNARISFDDIVDSLTSDDNKRPLSAKQGKELKALIDSILGDDEDGTVSNSTKFDGHTINEFLMVSQVITDWEGYDPDDAEDEIKVVSAAIVKGINDLIASNHTTLTQKIEELSSENTELEARVKELEDKVGDGFEEISEAAVHKMWEDSKKEVKDEEQKAADDDTAPIES